MYLIRVAQLSFCVQSVENHSSLDVSIVEKLQQNTHVQPVVLQVQTKMAQVIVTLKIMPKNPEINLPSLEEKVKDKIKVFGGEVGKVEQEPIAFGLKALKLIFVMDESLGSTESLEEDIRKLKGIQSVEVTDVRRAIG